VAGLVKIVLAVRFSALSTEFFAIQIPGSVKLGTEGKFLLCSIE
jgi:hypothetical protein